MITQSELKSVLRYDPETGLFIWLQARRRNVRKPGDIAGKPRRSGYSFIWIDNKPHLAHRLAFLYMAGRYPNVIDHRDGDPSNNRWENLRECETSTLNNANMRKPSRNKSGVKGVSWAAHVRKWYASIQVNRRSYNLGYHETIEAAATAYEAAAIKHFGEFARTC